MPFDLSTAKPLEQPQSGGFDLSTAQPLEATQPQGPNFEGFSPLTDINIGGVSPSDVVGGANLAANLATGFAAKPIAGAAAFGDILQGEGLQGAETVKRETEKLQVPLSEEGQDVASQIGNAISSLAKSPEFAPIVEQLKKAQEGFSSLISSTGGFLADPIGSVASDVTGSEKSERQQTGEAIGGALSEAVPLTALEVSPFLKASTATAGKFSPDLISGKFGLNVLKKNTNKVESLKTLSPAKKKKLIADEIKSGNANIDNVTKFVTETGDVAVSKSSKQALKELGGDLKAQQTVSVIENMNAASKAQVDKMLNIIVKGRKEPVFGQSNRPSDILGESIANRAEKVFNINKAAGKEIGAVAEALKNKQVNISSVREKFFKSMEDLGVVLKEGEDGWVTPDFSRSRFVGGSQKDMTVLVNDLLNDSVGFKFAHELKRSIRDNLNFDPIGTSKIGKGKSENILKDLSSGIDEILDSTSKKYNLANIKFAKTKGMVDRFQKLAGKDVDIFDDVAKKVLSDKARRLTSRATSRAGIERDLMDIDNVLKDLGVNTFKDDIPSLIHTVNQLERIFKLAPENSLEGNLLRSGGNLLGGRLPSAGDVAEVVSKLTKSEKKDFMKKIQAFRRLTKLKSTVNKLKPEEQQFDFVVSKGGDSLGRAGKQ
jgi:hypothetical protein